MAAKKNARKSTVPTRRNLTQFRFSEEDAQRFVKLAVDKGYIGTSDMGNQAKLKAGVERMMVGELLGEKSNE
jgi:hypothetical protein